VSDDADLRAYYARGEERARLRTGAGMVEFERTCEILLRHLPPAPSVVADVGGGPGEYAVWLARRGHRVVLRDVVPAHVDEVRARAGAEGVSIDAGVADARRLDLDDDSADAFLLLGPIYHLRERDDRVAALREARRVTRPGGPVFIAAISRWAARLDGVLRQRLYETYPRIRELARESEETGYLPPLHEASFTASTHRPDQLRQEIADAGLELIDLVGVEGATFLLHDLDERLASPEAREVVLETARDLERVPELLGLGPHLLATARA
jgi:ubiquinone/menaquinone biosynthesis C-methylase UbiE